MRLGWFLLPLVCAAPVGAAPDLTAVAASGPRPAACGASGIASLWGITRGAEEVAFCSSLARGYAALRRHPAEALRAAEAAEKARPGRAAPAVLAGRALLVLGQPEAARVRLDHAAASEPHALDAPEALHDWGVAALLTEHLETARRAYRALVPRVGLMSDEARARRVLVEAAAVVMTEGVGALDEAASYLGEARARLWTPGQREVVLGELALALSRGGRQDLARGVVAEAEGRLFDPDDPAATGPGAVGEASPAPLLPRGEAHAVAATLAEPDDRDEARSEWQRYLEAVGGEGIWAEHARARLRALGGR